MKLPPRFEGLCKRCYEDVAEPAGRHDGAVELQRDEPDERCANPRCGGKLAPRSLFAVGGFFRWKQCETCSAQKLPAAP